MPQHLIVITIYLLSHAGAPSTLTQLMMVNTKKMLYFHFIFTVFLQTLNLKIKIVLIFDYNASDNVAVLLVLRCNINKTINTIIKQYQISFHNIEGRD